MMKVMEPIRPIGIIEEIRSALRAFIAFINGKIKEENK